MTYRRLPPVIRVRVTPLYFADRRVSLRHAVTLTVTKSHPDFYLSYLKNHPHLAVPRARRRTFIGAWPRYVLYYRDKPHLLFEELSPNASHKHTLFTISPLT